MMRSQPRERERERFHPYILFKAIFIVIVVVTESKKIYDMVEFCFRIDGQRCIKISFF